MLPSSLQPDAPRRYRRRRSGAAHEEPALHGSVLASMPAKRLGRPGEVASVVLFLASPLARWVTAQIIGVNGGQGFAN
ncbi:MAG: SDR family oxidoreductase [Betaproteobacteria bacterium]